MCKETCKTTKLTLVSQFSNILTLSFYFESHGKYKCVLSHPNDIPMDKPADHPKWIYTVLNFFTVHDF